MIWRAFLRMPMARRATEGDVTLISGIKTAAFYALPRPPD